jgi:RNA polymerase sigma-70 factor (ECF subfamily)
MGDLRSANFSPARPVVGSKEDDAMLVAATLAGDPQAFTVLVERYTRPLWNVAYRITRSREDAADAAQSAFVRCFQSLDRFDPQRRFFSWIYRIAVNCALDLVAQRRTESLPEEPKSGHLPLARESEARETSLAVREAIAQLSPDYRALVTLRHYVGLSYEEMAEVLDLPVALVRSRLFAARRRLQDLLGPVGVTAP